MIDQLHFNSTYAIFALIVFFIAYIFVILEELIQLRKSKPVILASGIIWILASISAPTKEAQEVVITSLKHNLLDYVELFLFLLCAMTYVNALEERQLFKALKCWLLKKRCSLRQLFWITGWLAFFISPIADNMTTALIMGTVVLGVTKDPRFIPLAFVNLVVAANAGGAFSPFGDITTLMVWQKGILSFQSFFNLFVPCLINFLIPAFILSFFIPKTQPDFNYQHERIRPGGFIILFLFLFTIIMTVFINHYYKIPACIGMMSGLALLQFYSFYLKIKFQLIFTEQKQNTFDIFNKIRAIEWDTLLFFYGIILCIGGLAIFGYLHLFTNSLYNMGSYFKAVDSFTTGNILLGIASAFIDNIPLMFSVLTINPNMSEGQWLLITLTTGVGGSLLSIGSAAGVALMGQAKGLYTFFQHFKWSFVVFIGYMCSIIIHFIVNGHLF